jgi:putative glycosyl hydrolase-like family 6 (GHL6) protein
VKRREFLALPLCSAAFGQTSGWWMNEPIRLLQTNLRETDSALDPERLVRQLADFKANVLLFGMGGIVAHYPTRVEFHYPSAYIKPGHDPFGEVLKLAHARGIRVIGRFDFSKTRKAVYDAHPEWFFRQASGEPVIYNGLYSTCINGGYYRVQAMKILEEALELYDVDGLFFNMFGNQSRDYSGRDVGICHCESCRRGAGGDHTRFMYDASREVAAAIGRLIRARRPAAGYFNYIQQHTDGIMSESNTSVTRPLPLWPYASSDNVNRARNSEPGRMAINLCMTFVDFPWRFATVPQAEIALRLWQNVAHGGGAAMAMLGTMDQQDQRALDAARPVYAWLAANQRSYVRQESAARVLLLGAAESSGRGKASPNYRGLFRLLSEEHIPFAVCDNLDWIGKRQFDLVIATDWVPPELESFVRGGGRLLLASSQPPPFPAVRVVKQWKGVQGYFRVRDASFPSLARTRLIFLAGDYAETEPVAHAGLTLIPPSMFGPPEKVHVDAVETEKPGLVARDFAKGKLTWIPWDAGALYYRHGNEAHSGLLRDLIDGLLPAGRQLRTNAHPLMEISLMRQEGRRLVHLVNLSGHSDTAYFAPVPMSNIRIDVRGNHRSARALRMGRTLPVTVSGGYTGFTIPAVGDYEAVVLE